MYFSSLANIPHSLYCYMMLSSMTFYGKGGGTLPSHTVASLRRCETGKGDGDRVVVGEHVGEEEGACRGGSIAHNKI